MRTATTEPIGDRSVRPGSGPAGLLRPVRRGMTAVAGVTTISRTRFDRLLERAAPVAPIALRLSLGLIFLWFGVLKLAGDSPVTTLVSATLPWGDPDMVVRLLGVVEVGLGIGLLVGKAQRLLLVVLALHLAGTFLTFVMAPSLTMQGGNPLLLTADGEFVLKNLVLISAALLLACQRPAAARALTCGDGVQ
jgi:putative oxidoreductase